MLKDFWLMRRMGGKLLAWCSYDIYCRENVYIVWEEIVLIPGNLFKYISVTKIIIDEAYGFLTSLTEGGCRSILDPSYSSRLVIYPGRGSLKSEKIYDKLSIDSSKCNRICGTSSPNPLPNYPMTHSARTACVPFTFNHTFPWKTAHLR